MSVAERRGSQFQVAEMTWCTRLCFIWPAESLCKQGDIMADQIITSLTCNILSSSFIDLCVLSGLEKQLSF